MYLENIYSPEDVKKLSFEELDKLSGESSGRTSAKAK